MKQLNLLHHPSPTDDPTHNERKTSVRKWGFILILAGVLFFSGLHRTYLWDEDEGFYASTAAEMYQRQDWVVPYFNGELFGHKPPLMFWMMMLGFSLFDITEFGARFFSACFAVATVVLVHQLAAALFNSRVGIWAALIFATSFMFTVVGKTATPDSFLVFFITLSLFVFVKHGINRKSENGLSGHQVIPQSWLAVATMYAAMGLATLTKGPVGFLLPMAAIGLFLMLTSDLPQRLRHADGYHHDWRIQVKQWTWRLGLVNFFTCLWRMRPLTAIGVMIVIAGPWFIAVGVQTDWEFHRQFFGTHHLHRFSASMDGHSGSIVYYPVSILIGMFPWSVITVPAILIFFGGLTANSSQRSSYLFVTCWIIVVLSIFSLAATKLPNYILPAYPAIAIAFAVTLDNWICEAERFRPFWHRASFFSLTLTGLVLVVGFPILCLVRVNGLTVLDRVGAATDIQNQLAWLGLMGVPALMGGLVGWWAAERSQRMTAAIALATSAYLTVFGAWNFAAPWADQFQSTQRLAKRYASSSNDALPLASYGFFRPTMVFYYRQPITRCWDISDVDQFFANHPSGRLIAKEADLATFYHQPNFDFAIEHQQSRFPEKGTIVVLMRRLESDVASKTSDQVR